MFSEPEPHLPYQLDTLTGIAKERIRALRSRYSIGLLHSDDEAPPPGVSLSGQMPALQYRAERELGTSKRTRQ